MLRQHMKTRHIKLQDRLAKKSTSPIGGTLFQHVEREDGSTFLQPIHNTTLIGASQLMALKICGLEGTTDVNKTSLNNKEIVFVNNLDKDTTLAPTLLTTVNRLNSTRELFGVAFGLEGAGSYEIEKVHRYEKGWDTVDLLPLRYFTSEALDNSETNYRAGYLLRSLQNGTVSYFIKRLEFNVYNQVVGGNKLGTQDPSVAMNGMNADCETIIEANFTITGDDFKTYFAEVKQNHYARRISSVKFLYGIPCDVTLANGAVVRDYRDIIVGNVIPLSTLNLGKDNSVNFTYKIYI